MHIFKLKLNVCSNNFVEPGLAFTPKYQTSVILVIYLVGKAASSAGAEMLWMYTSELYPTNLRGQVNTISIEVESVS
jgi:hypothetical protein